MIYKMNKIISKKPGKIPKKYWEIIYDRDGPNCNECGGRTILLPEYQNLVNGSNRHPPDIQNALRNLRFSFGHVIPVSRGGNDTLDNLVGEHFWCNNEKGNKLHLPVEKISYMRKYANAYVPHLLNLLDS